MADPPLTAGRGRVAGEPGEKGEKILRAAGRGHRFADNYHKKWTG